MLSGVPKSDVSALIVYEKLVELKLMKYGIPYSDIQKMHENEIDTYIGTIAALEEKERQNQEIQARQLRNMRP